MDQAEKDRKDAERYRWLKDRAHMVPADSWSNALEIRLPLLGGKSLDDAIDARMLTTEPLLVAPPVTIDVPDCPMDVYMSMDMGDG